MSARTEEQTEARGRFARLYGAQPWHLVTLLACFALTGYAVSRILDSPALFKIVVWFLGAAVVWDLVVGPLYALADRALRPLGRRDRVSPLNHVRAPALVSSLLLIVWTPLIFQRSEQVYQAKSDLRQDPYLERWAAVTAVLFLVSAVVYAVRVLRARRHAEAPGTAPDGSAADPAG